MTMKRLVSMTLIALLVVIGLSSPVLAEMATMDDASTVANNWITLIIEKKGDWGGSETAEVVEIREFKRDERVIGYFCHVEPQGFIVISLHKQLAPVKAYSATCDLDPESDKGMADLLKGGMGRILDQIDTTTDNLTDLCYVYNFEDSTRPRALVFPAGEGKQFKEGLELCVELLRKNIPVVLRSESTASEKGALLESFSEQKKEQMDKAGVKPSDIKSIKDLSSSKKGTSGTTSEEVR